MTDATPKTRATELDASLVDQLKWSAAALGLGRVECEAERILIEPHAASVYADTTGGTDGAASGSSHPMPVLGSQKVAAASLATQIPREREAVVAWLRQARQVGEQSPSGAWEAEPAGDPERIREIAGPLLSPFTIRDGHSRLAGCTLEKRPVLRLGRLIEEVDASSGEPTVRVHWRYYAADGSVCDGDTIERRGWDRLRTTQNRLRASERISMEAWVAAVPGDDPAARRDLVDVTVLWCRWASGKIIIQFDSGPSASIPFAGWASDYALGHLQPPRFHCDRTGIESYEVIALEDGTVTVPEAVGRCDLTGRELPGESLGTCAASSLRVDREYLVACEATGRLGLADHLVRCQWCDRRLVPEQIQRGRCEQCRHAAPIAPGDPRLRALRQRNPQALAELGSGRGWIGWIAGEVGVIVGGRMLRNRMLVFDPNRGTVIRRGTRGGFSRRWKIETVAEPGDELA